MRNYNLCLGKSQVPFCHVWQNGTWRVPASDYFLTTRRLKIPIPAHAGKAEKARFYAGFCSSVHTLYFTRNDEVVGSIPTSSSRKYWRRASRTSSGRNCLPEDFALFQVLLKRCIHKRSRRPFIEAPLLPLGVMFLPCFYFKAHPPCVGGRVVRFLLTNRGNQGIMDTARHQARKESGAAVSRKFFPQPQSV